MTPSIHDRSAKIVILSLSDKDRRRTSTSTMRTTSNRTTFPAGTSGFPIAAIYYLIASYRLLIAVY
jgi:hypothetical protein